MGRINNKLRGLRNKIARLESTIGWCQSVLDGEIVLGNNAEERRIAEKINSYKGSLKLAKQELERMKRVNVESTNLVKDRKEKFMLRQS